MTSHILRLFMYDKPQTPTAARYHNETARITRDTHVGSSHSLRGGAPRHAAVGGSGCVEERALPAQQVQLRRDAARAEGRARVRRDGRPGERVHERRGGGPQPEDDVERGVDEGRAR